MAKDTNLKRRLIIGIMLFLTGIVTLILRRYLYVGILSLLLIILSAAFILLSLLRYRVKPRSFKKLITVFHILFCLFGISFFIAEGFIISTAVSANQRNVLLPEDIDTVVVAGAGLNGKKPSLLYKIRLDKAKAIADANPDCRIVICGGQGNDELLSESAAGKNYLLDIGMEPDRIFIEETSLDTAENIRNFTLLYPKESHIALVTNDFHAFRCGLLAKRYGLSAALYSSPTPKSNLILNYFTREYISLIIAWIESMGLTLDTANTHLSLPYIQLYFI